MFAVFENNKMITVSLSKQADGREYVKISKEQRRQLYEKGYNRHSLQDGAIIYNPPTPEEKNEKNKQARINEINNRLEEIDKEAGPPLIREILLEMGKKGKLETLENEAIALRAELSTLKGQQ